MHIGERADVIVCADQEPGYYPIELHYDYACTMSPHGGPGGLPPFIPPGFHEVSSCRFYSFLHYTGQKEWFYGPPTSDKGTGGGKNPKPVAGVPFDLTRPADWKKTKMLNRPSWLKDKPDYSYTVTLGLSGPLYSKPTDIPLTKGRWYVVFSNVGEMERERERERGRERVSCISITHTLVNTTGTWMLTAEGRVGIDPRVLFFTRKASAVLRRHQF